MTIEPGKEGYLIIAETGFSFRTDPSGQMHAYKDYPLGELVPVFISRNKPPMLGLISDGGQIKIPKIACPKV